jgi:hypothetical protein
VKNILAYFLGASLATEKKFYVKGAWKKFLTLAQYGQYDLEKMTTELSARSCSMMATELSL